MLGILAYQNRDKLGTLLRGKDRIGLDPNNPQAADGGGLIEQIIDGVGSGGGLGDILERFRNAGSSEQVDSWVRQGPNKPIDGMRVLAAIDPETLEELSRQTGLSREELLERIAKDLPEAVDQMTPNGCRTWSDAMTGYQKSPDYGGPRAAKWFVAVWLIALVLASATVWLIYLA